ncbi:MAG: HlyD family efflux transporter periplasmic adaptor subunit [Sulfurovaceae bacterium]|nr:HlyD family efflux transporter periplasmic adaptor subunit [Sulfurovaceae bacterium]
MSKNIIKLIILCSSLSLGAVKIPIDEVEKRNFSESIAVNSQVVQLPSAKEQINAQRGGKVVKYFVKEGDRVQKGKLVAEIKSLDLAVNIAEIKALKRQLRLVNKNYELLKKLYDIGVESEQKLNRQEEEQGVILSKIDILQSSLDIVGADGDRYKLYAQTTGRVEKILSPINSVVGAETALISIVKGKESFLIKSFIPLSYATKIRVGQKGLISYGDKNYKIHITQILPKIDEKTQKMKVLSTLDESVQKLFVNSFLESKFFIGESKKYLTVKKSALSFFKNEWVVFVPKHHDEHDDHEKEEHDDHEEHEKEGHDEHEDEEIPYETKVVKVIKQNDKYVAIEGLNEHDDYVSDKSYHIKSLLLKSSLGGHGH